MQHKRYQGITPQERALILARLEQTHSATAVAAEVGRSETTVKKVADEAGILLRTDFSLVAVPLLTKITGKRYLIEIDSLLGLSAGTLSQKLYSPANYSDKWVREKICDKLRVLFPDKKADIAALELLLCDRTSATAIKRSAEKEQQDFREAAGILLRELRENCSQEAEAIKATIQQPIVQRNFERIESGDTRLAASVYRDAIRELCPRYKGINPEAAMPYIIQLERISLHLKR